MTERRLTPEMIEAIGAATQTIDKFRKEWPDGCVPDYAFACRCVELGIDLDFAAAKLLPADGDVRLMYDADATMIHHRYTEASDNATAIFERSLLRADEAYGYMLAAAKKRYETARAIAFARAWGKQ